jgi:hypothetical protein
LLGDILPYQNYTYEVILCRPDKTEISVLDAINIEVNKRFNGIDQLNFEVNWQSNDWVIQENPDFKVIIADYLLKLVTKINDEVIEEKLFIIDSASENYIEKDYKLITAYSYEYTWSKKILRGYKQTAKLYDDVGNNGIMNYILSNKLMNTWSVNYISPSLLNNYRSFEFPENSLIDVIKQLEESFACLFFFNTIEQTIDVVLASESGVNTGLFLDEQKLKTIKREILNNELYTRLYITGKDNLTIASKNVTGQLFLDDFTFYRTSEYMSQSLLTALNNYDLVLETYEGIYQSHLIQLTSLNTQLLNKENELSALKAEKLIIEDSLDSERNTYTSNTPNYNNLFYSLQTKLSQISVKEAEINNIKSQINAINIQISSVNLAVSYQNNFTTTLLKELDYFIREKSITLSDIDNIDTLYSEAKYQLSLYSIPIMQIEVSSVDLLSCVEFQHDWKKLKLGDIVNVYYEKINTIKNILPFYGESNNSDKTILLRLVVIKHNPSSNTLDLTFCSTNILSTDHLYMRDINVKANRFATILEVEKPSYEEFQTVKNEIIYQGATINVNSNQIEIGNNYINQRGFIGKDIGSNGGAIQVKNDKIIFSSDNWQSFFTMLSGNGLFLETTAKTSRVVIQPSTGFQLDIFNPALNNYRNAIYLGLDSESKPAMFIDNGYISLTRIISGVEMNKIFIDPSIGFKIQVKESDNWVDKFFIDTNGNLIAKSLRSSSDNNNYIILEDQYVDFWNGGLKKLQLGFTTLGEIPYMVWGAGDQNQRNLCTMFKNQFGFFMQFTTSSGVQNSISMYNSGVNGFSNGGIEITGDCLFSGGRLGFFGGNPVSKNTSMPEYIDIGSDLPTAISGLNTLIYALRSYNLI